MLKIIFFSLAFGMLCFSAWEKFSVQKNEETDFMTAPFSQQGNHKKLSLQTPILKTYSIDSFLQEDSQIESEINNIFKTLTSEQKAGMVLMPAWNASTDISEVLEWKKKYSIGSVFILRKNFTVENIQKIKQQANLPLLIAIDAEPSLLYKNFTQLDKKIQNTNQLNTIKKSQEAAQKIAQKMKKFGIDINFAPVYDNGKNKQIIGNRAFSIQNKQVQTLATAFSESLKKENIFSTAKHFPGHGNVQGDSHYTLPKIIGSLTELENFKYAIKYNIPIIMIGHLAITDNIKYNTKGLPSTVSKNIVTGLLRKKLNFKGLIITDAMNMAAVTNIKNAEIKALEAGADIVLMPNNLEKTYTSLLQKISSEKKFREQIDTKVKKILKMKILNTKILKN